MPGIVVYGMNLSPLPVAVDLSAFSRDGHYIEVFELKSHGREGLLSR